MSGRENEAIVRRYFSEVWNKGDLDAAGEIIATDFSMHGCGAISGLDAVKLYILSYRELCPTVHFTMLSVRAHGDQVAACWVSSGTHAAYSSCDDATAARKNSVTTGLSIYRIKDGKIVEAWAGTQHADILAARRLGITRDGNE